MLPLNKLKLLLLSISVVLAACSSSGTDQDEMDQASSFTNDEPTAGRLLLATQCAQCHGTDGYSLTEIDSIAGEERSEIIEETTEDANDPGDLMGFHGSAYLDLGLELEAIADYISNQ